MSKVEDLAPVKRAVYGALIDLGFRKKTGQWLKDLPDVFQLVWLQKSNHANYYYVNLGIFLKRLAPHVVPRSTVDCHLQSRSHEFMQHDIERWTEAFDEDSSITVADRTETIKNGMLEVIAPDLAQLSTESGILDYVRQRPNRRFRVTQSLYEEVHGPQDRRQLFW